jgi:hypothetical protein
MNVLKLFAVSLLALGIASAGSFSYTGAFTQDDNVQLFNFTVGSSSTVTLLTLSYAGGVNAASATIARGGFDPILAVFDSAGMQIDQNDDGGSNVPVDLSGVYYDTYLQLTLGPGNYTVAVMEFDNFAIGPNLSDGFQRTGQGNFTASDSFSAGCGSATAFCDVSGSAYRFRDNHWAFDILNVANASQVNNVPEPATVLMALSGLALVGALRRRTVKG